MVTDAQLFLSLSGPLAARAQQSHDALLRASSLPWWDRLDDITSPLSPASQVQLNVGMDCDWMLDGPVKVI